MSLIRDIARHLDKEMAWMVKEKVSQLHLENEVLKRGKLCEEIGRLVGEIMIERIGSPGEYLLPYTVEEFGEVGLDSIRGMDDATKIGNSDDASFHVAETCVAFALMRTRGMKSFYTRREVPGNDYWPFGQDGGFCNPRKLKMLD